MACHPNVTDVGTNTTTGDNNTNNWGGGTINGSWNPTLVLSANQKVTFGADTILGGGLSLGYAGNYSLTFEGTGGNRTLTLGGDIAVSPVSGSAATPRIGNIFAGQNLLVNLGGTTRTMIVSTNTLTIVNGITNGALNKTGSGTLVVGGDCSYTGRTLVSAGALTLTGVGRGGGNMIIGGTTATSRLNVVNGCALSTAELTIGDNDTGYSGSPTALSGSAAMSGGSIEAKNWLIVGRQGGTGTLNQSAGTITNPATASGYVAVGWRYNGSGGAGTYNLSGTAQLAANSALNVSGIGASSITIGESSGDSGRMALSNSAQVVAANRVLLGHNAGATGALSVNDTASFAATNTNGGVMVWSGTGSIAVNGGTFSANWVTLGQNGGSTGTFTQAAGVVTMNSLWTTSQGVGTYNLDGGTLAVSNFNKGSGSGTLNFNGGRLIAAGNWTLGGGNVSVAQIRNNGAIIDSAGRDITISQPLVHSSIAGDNVIDGGLVKEGGGSLRLAGPNTYNGDTIVSNGSLIVGTGFSGSGNVVVAGGAKFSVTNATGASASISNLSAGAGAVLEFQNVTNTTTPLISARDVSCAAGCVVRIAGTNGLTAGQSYPLIAFSGTFGGSVTNLQLQIPYGWRAALTTNANQLMLAGVAPVATTPTNLAASVSGSSLQINWPAGHTGWRLQRQTNLIDGAWLDVPESEVTNMVFLLLTNDCNFYRLLYP